MKFDISLGSLISY